MVVIRAGASINGGGHNQEEVSDPPGRQSKRERYSKVKVFGEGPRSSSQGTLG